MWETCVGGGAGVFLKETACDDVGQTQLTEDRVALGNTIARNWRQLVPPKFWFLSASHYTVILMTMSLRVL